MSASSNRNTIKENYRKREGLLNFKGLSSFLIDKTIFKERKNYNIEDSFSEGEYRSDCDYALVTFTNTFSRGRPQIIIGDLRKSPSILAEFPAVPMEGTILVFDVPLFEAMHGPHKKFFGWRAYSYKSSQFFAVNSDSITQSNDLPLPPEKILSHPAIFLVL